MKPTFTLLVPLAFLASGCATSPAPDGPGGTSFPTSIREYSSGQLRFVSLEPLPVGETPTIHDRSVMLDVGALYAGPREADEGEHTLALVLRSVTRGSGPILTSGRDLLLDVDGTWVAGNPEPGGHTYQVEGTARGISETVMVPVTPDLLRQVARADVVRGRLGPWFSFVLPPSQRAALGRILDEIPEGVSYRMGRPARALVASQ